jgi:hypothetical protein
MLARPILYSGALLAILVVLLALTDLGATYPQFAQSAIRTWQRGQRMTFEQRQRAFYHETFQVLLYIRECSAPDAVILLPPRDFIIAKTGEICLLASPSSCYNFIHPRVPVHYGDASPRVDDITHLLIWEHWGLDKIDPPQAPSPHNRVDLIPIQKGHDGSW